MAVHSFTLVPAAYVYLLRPAPDSAAGRAGATSRSESAETQVLLQLRQGTGYMDGHWACGASGHVEAAESVVETALRETREELGVRAATADLSPLTAMHRTNDLGGAALEQRIDLFFTLRTWEGTPAVHEPAKNAGLRWFSLNDLPEAVPPHERHVLTLLAACQYPRSPPSASRPARISPATASPCRTELSWRGRPRWRAARVGPGPVRPRRR